METKSEQNSSEPHSNAYFQNKRIRRHLIKVGLINRHGDILSPKMHRAAIARQEKRRRAKQELTHHISDYVLLEERRRQAFIRNYFEFATKRSRVQQIRESKQRTGRSLSHRVHHRIDLGKNRSPSPLERSKNPSVHRSPKRVKSAHPAPRNVKNLLVHRSITGKPKSDHDYCQVTMIYYGPPNDSSDHKRSSLQLNPDEILVLQQHCGGENLPVYKGFVRPNETFTFDSRRHPDYPFALALYINGLFDSRISVCCEYKHKHNVRLGSRYGLFGIYDVRKSQPCRMCRFEECKKKLFPTNTSTETTPSYRKPMVTTEFPLEVLLRTPITSSERPPSKRDMNRISTVVQAGGSPRRLSASSTSSKKKETDQSDTTLEETKGNHQKSSRTSSRTSKESRQSASTKSFPDKMHHLSEPNLNQKSTDDARSSSESSQSTRTPTPPKNTGTNKKNRYSSSSSSSSNKSFEGKISHPSEPIPNRKNTSDSESSSSTLESPRLPAPFKQEDTNDKKRRSSSTTSRESRQSSSNKRFENQMPPSSKPISNQRNASGSRSSNSKSESIRTPESLRYENMPEYKRPISRSSSSTSKISSSSSSISLGIKNNNRPVSSSSSSSFFLEKGDDQPAMNATSIKDEPTEISPRPPSRAETRSSSSSDSQNEVKKDTTLKKYLSSSSSTTESDDDTIRSDKPPRSSNASDQIDQSNKNKHRRSSSSSTSSSESILRTELVEKNLVDRKIDSNDDEQFD